MLKKLIFITSIIVLSNIAIAEDFKPQIGDLLFQDLNCGTLCNGINSVTHGIKNTYMSHVAMVYSIKGDKITVIEANSKGVVLSSLDTFLDASHDKNGNPMVIEERLKPQYQYLIPKAISYAKTQLGKPYNVSFTPNTEKSFYCSSLIYSAFSSANHGKPIFKTHGMNFNDPQTGKIATAWQDYFKNLKVKVPQGLTGTNPGMLSRSDKLIVVHVYGELRRHK
jgi:uncharacterized protein YycO